MSQLTLVGPPYNAKPFNTGDSTELGQHPKEIVDNINTMFTELYAGNATAAALAAAGAVIQSTDVTVTSAQLLALHATPQQILAAPGANLAIILEGVVVFKAAGTAYAGIAAGEDLAINYTNGAGVQLTSVETTGFLDQATAQTRYAPSYRAASGVADITPAANAALVMQLLSGEITTGTSDLKLRVYYRVVPTVL